MMKLSKMQIKDLIKEFLKSIRFKICIGILIFGLFIICYNLFFYPAYISVIGVCLPDGEKITRDMGYVTSGVFEFNITSGKGEIYINPEVADEKTLRHEKCHESQAKNHRLNTCYESIALWWDETECYISQYLPNKIFSLFYK